MIALRLDQHMYVIGHDCPSEQPITFAIKMEQRIFDDLCDPRLLEPARSGTCI
jgi:hypothetical protein